MTLCKLCGIVAVKGYQPICMLYAYENNMYSSFLSITAINAHMSLSRQADQDP